VRHVSAHPLAFAIVALTVLFTTMCAAAAASFTSSATSIAVRRLLTADRGTAIDVSVPAPAADAPGVPARVSRTLTTAAAGLPLAIATGRQSPVFRLPGRYHHGGQAFTQIVSLPALPAHAVLRSGSWPAGMTAGGTGTGGAAGAAGVAGAAGSSTPVPACLPAPAARRLQLSAGDLLRLRDVPEQTTITVRVTCIFARRQAASPYWSLSPVGPAGSARTGAAALIGPLVTSPAVLAGRHIPVQTAVLAAQPEFGTLRPASLAGLAARLGATVTSLTGSESLDGAMVTTRLPGLLGELAGAAVVARSQLLIGLLILLVIAGATVTVTVRLLVLAREAEVALLAARGASRRQLAARGLADALMLAVPAAVAGPFLAGWLLVLLTRSGPLARSGLVLHAGQPAAAWLAAGAVAAGCAVIISLPWLRRPPSAVMRRVQAGRQRAIGAAVSAGADLALVVLAAAATWQLAHFSAPVTTGLAGRLGADPILVSAPVLAIAAGSLVTLRLLPLAARLADRAAARSRGLTGAVAAWQLSRRPLRHPGPALLAMFAVATAVVALAENSSWHASVQAQAAFSVGADTAVTPPAARPLAAGQTALITGAPGVLASTPAVLAQASTAQGTPATVLAVNGPAAGRVLPLGTASGGASPARLAAQLARLRPAGPLPGTAIGGRPGRLQITARLRVARSSPPGQAGRPAIAAPVLGIQLTDAAGVAYQVSAGSLPADGRRHQLTAVIGRRADYPLRLTGFSLDYLQTGHRAEPGRLVIGPVRAAAAGRPGQAIAAVPAGRPLLGLGAGGPASSPGALGAGAGAAALPRQVIARAGGPGVTVRFRTGKVQGGQGGGPASTSLAVTAGPVTGPLPALATRSFLAASGVGLGHVVQAQVQGASIPVRVVGEVTRFPAVTGASGGLIVDQATMQESLRTRGLPPAVPAEWLLRTSGTVRLAGLPPGTTVVSSAARAAALSRQPLSVAPLLALLAIAVAAIALACGGFVVSAATGQDRQRDIAMLDALGARSAQVMWMVCLEQAMTAVPAALAGLALGGLLSQLIVPAVSLTARGVHPVPPVVVQVPWLLAAGIAVVIAGIPVLAAGAPALRARAVAAMLRTQEET
jgi:hypothetical protein